MRHPYRWRREEIDLKKRAAIVSSLAEKMLLYMHGKRVRDMELAYWYARFVAHLSRPLLMAGEVTKQDFQKAGWWMTGGES